MWPADDASVGGGQVWWWYVNCKCATRSLSLYIIHMDAWKRSGGLIEVFAPYNAHYTHICGQPVTLVMVDTKYGASMSTTAVVL